MQNYYERELLLTSTLVDRKCRLGLFQVGMILQDAMTELFYSFGCDGLVVARDCAALWAFARFKFHMDACPVWMDKVRVRVFPVRVTSITVHLNTVIETLDGQTILRCRQEMCALDLRDHSLRKIDTVPYPRDLDLLPPVYTAPYNRMKAEFEKKDFIYEKKVYTLDTDMNSHMNNVAYLRAITDAFPSAFWDHHRVTDFDIHYRNEGMEADRLQVYRKEKGDGFTVLVKNSGGPLVQAFLKVEAIPEEVDG